MNNQKCLNLLNYKERVVKNQDLNKNSEAKVESKKYLRAIYVRKKKMMNILTILLLLIKYMETSNRSNSKNSNSNNYNNSNNHNNSNHSIPQTKNTE